MIQFDKHNAEYTHYSCKTLFIQRYCSPLKWTGVGRTKLVQLQVSVLKIVTKT